MSQPISTANDSRGIFFSKPLSANEPDYFLGLDAGGSTTTGRLIDAAGRCLAEVSGGPGNVSTDAVGTVNRIKELAGAALFRAGLPPNALPTVRVGVGLAGYEISRAADCIKLHAQWPFHSIRAAHDGLIACLGAHAGEAGAVVIVGTGVCGSVFSGGVSRKIAGWGHQLSDLGGGAWIGRQALCTALQVLDGIRSGSGLTAEIIERFPTNFPSNFSNKQEAICLWSASAKGGDYASWAPLVTHFAAASDPVALEIMQAAGGHIAALTKTLMHFQPPRISMVGGLAEILLKYLPADVAGVFSSILGTAVDGALMLAQLPE